MVEAFVQVEEDEQQAHFIYLKKKKTPQKIPLVVDLGWLHAFYSRSKTSKNGMLFFHK